MCLVGSGRIIGAGEIRNSKVRGAAYSFCASKKSKATAGGATPVYRLLLCENSGVHSPLKFCFLHVFAQIKLRLTL